MFSRRANEQNNGNTFSTRKNDVANCEHRSQHRTVVADNNNLRDNPVDCAFCEGVILNGTAV